MRVPSYTTACTGRLQNSVDEFCPEAIFSPCGVPKESSALSRFEMRVSRLLTKVRTSSDAGPSS